MLSGLPLAAIEGDAYLLALSRAMTGRIGAVQPGHVATWIEAATRELAAPEREALAAGQAGTSGSHERNILMPTSNNVPASSGRRILSGTRAAKWLPT
jgi:hypothetical protein